MQSTTSLYKRLLLSDGRRILTKLWIGYGTGSTISVPESNIFSIRTHHSLFEGETPIPGCTVAGEIEIVMLDDGYTIPKMAMLRPFISILSEDGSEQSEWVQLGVFYIDTREVTQNDDGLNILTIHGYDAMLKAQDDYPSDSTLDYPAVDTAVVGVIANAMGLEVDDRTWELMTGSYRYGLPAGYSMQEVLSSIAIPYAANWIITETGKLRLVGFTRIPLETRLLTDEYGYTLVFGSDRILV